MGTDLAVDVTTLLGRWRAGSVAAEEELMARVHRELRQIAARYLRRERRGHTLEPTAVVNEVYLRLMPQRTVPWESRAHFFKIAARMTRRVLVDYARRRRTAKREGVADTHISVTNLEAPAREADQVDILALHEALDALAVLDRRQAEIVELRSFGGLTVEEVGHVLNISPATVKRDWTSGRLWLRRRMQAAPAASKLGRP